MMLRTRWWLVVPIALLSVTVGATLAQDDMPPAPPGRLLVGDENGLFTLLADGSDKTYILEETDPNCWLRDGAWHPSGTRFIYTAICGGSSAADWRPDPDRDDLEPRTAAVYLYDLESGDNDELIANDGSFQDYAGDWHPGGSAIVIYSDRGDGDVFNLFSFDLDSGELAQLTDFDSNVSRVSYDPTGRYLLFNRRIVQPESTTLRFEVRAYDVDSDTEFSVAEGLTPNWSPDGEWIAFATEGAASDIFIMPSACIYDGGGCDASSTARNVTRTPDVAEREPLFSPDQAALVYLVDTNPQPTAFTWDLVRHDLRSGARQNLTNTTSVEERHRGWEPLPDVERANVADMMPVVVQVSTAEGPANLRSGPSTNAARVGQARRAEMLFVQGRNADTSWYLVVTQDGTEAWIFADLVQIVEGDPASMPVVQ